MKPLQLLATGALLAAAQICAALAPESLARMRYVGDAQISPDGRRIAYVVSQADLARDGYETDLWLIERGAAPRPIVTARGDDLRPRWSPDGTRLAFLSSRTGERQIHILEMRGGEAWALTHEPAGVSAFSWSPDGRRIAYLARPAGPGQPPAEGAAPAGRARITERLFFRFDGTPGFAPESRARLFVIEARPDAGKATGPLTDGRTELSEPAWSADGEALLFSAVPSDDRAEIASDSEIYRVPADGSGAVQALSNRRGADSGPIVAADSGLIAWTGFDDAEAPRSAYVTELYVMRPDGSQRRSLTAAFDRNVGETANTDAAAPRMPSQRVAFAPGGRELLFVAADRGSTRLHGVPVAGGAVRSLSDELAGDLREFSVARTGRIAAVFGSPAEPYEVWSLERPGARWRRLTRHGIDALRDARLVPYEDIEVASFDGRPIQGWIIKPPGFDPARKYPLILYIHGGPHTMYGRSFFHEFQLLASAGYIVLITNPRGSTGYGGEFANLIQYRYPGDDYRDLMAALEALLERGYVDERRLGVAGGSGGGLLAAWTVAQTGRFAAALVERPVTNWLSFAAGSSDRHAFFVRYWFRDYPWRDAADYLSRSPLSHVDKVQTPVLVIQSEQDYRTPVDQGLQYYSALRMLGKEARLALFPGSAHGLSRDGPPSQRIERLRIIRAWFDEKLQR